MRNLKLPLALLFFCGSALLPLLSHAARAPSVTQAPLEPVQKGLPYVPGEILVRFNKDSSIAKVERTNLTVGETNQIPVRVEQLAGAEIVEGLRLARVATGDTLAAVAALKRRPDVLYAELNSRRYKTNVPNDARYSEQWNLKNTGQRGGFAGADIKAEPAWDITTGDRNIVVGVVDEGIDINHSDLRDNIWVNPGEIPNDGIDNDQNGFVDDVNGWDFLHNDKTVFDYTGSSYPPPVGYTQDVDDHGTHVAGILGATGNNANGIAGVNWRVSLMPLKFLGPAGGTTANLVSAFAYAKLMKDRWVSSGGAQGANIRILNNSYAGDSSSQAEFDAIRALGDSGILFVAAAGNNSRDIDRLGQYPANYELDNIVVVTASDQSDRLAINLSNYGARSVDIAAPGREILSTTPLNTYLVASGTSMAAPHASGIAALVCAASPAISLQRLRDALLFGGDINSDLIGKTTTGRRASAVGSIQSAMEADVAPPAAATSLAIANQSGRNVTLQFVAPGDDGTTGRASVYEVRYSDIAITTSEQFSQAFRVAVPSLPETAGALQSLTLQIPYRHLNGFLAIRATDNVGNIGPLAQVAVAVPAAAGDPYIVSAGPASPLSTGGQRIFSADDEYHTYGLPFDFPFYDQKYTGLGISANGALYFFSDYPLPGGPSLDAESSLYSLNGLKMIAGMWDDLRTDLRPGDGIYEVKPDQNRLIFRWQGVTFHGERPINFEIELRRDGTILMRYGSGNQGLLPFVGISNGSPDAYVITSHSSEDTPIDLTNAQTITITLRNPPVADLAVRITANPTPVPAGNQLTYSVIVENLGPDAAWTLQIQDQLPAGTTFVSCSAGVPSEPIQPPCTGSPPVGSSGATVTTTVDALAGPISLSNSVEMRIVVNVIAPAGASLASTASASSFFQDPITANSSTTNVVDVFEDSGLAGVTSISAGLYFALAARTDGSALAWGANNWGQLGDDTTTDRLRPAQVTGLTDVIAVSAGVTHSLALKSDGTVWAWGRNDNGQLGNGDTSGTGSKVPIQVPGLTDVVAINASDEFNIVLKSDGTVWGWGRNESGVIGGPPQFRHYSPVRSNSLTNVRRIVCGSTFTLALRDDGTVWAWGDNSSTILGPDGTPGGPTPIRVNGLDTVTEIAASAHHAVVLKNDGTVWVWGYGFNGEFGDGTTSQRSTPGPASGISGVVAIGAGMGQTLAVKSDGTLWAWGFNSAGVLGDGTTTNRLTPVQLPNLSGVATVDGGFSSVLMALMNDGRVKSWGLGTSGQLGDGTGAFRPVAAPVSNLITVALPTFSIAGGSYTSVLDVAINCATIGAAIHYTTNGQDPTESDPVITAGATVRVDQTVSLKARAWKPGWTTSGVKTASYTISLPLNPIDDARTFIRQQYLDFLNREPDQGGWDYWTSGITQCGSDARCIHNHRIDVSAAFFIELEFQETGYVVYRMHRAAFGTLPAGPSRANVSFTTFMNDRGQLVAGPGLPQSTINFANAFVQRPEFLAVYPANMSNADFVNALFDKANLTPFTTERQQQIDAMNNNGKTRAQVLLDVIEIPAFKTREYNGAFVLMQYFGYLRRDPDQGGYDFWLNVLNNLVPGNFRSMVCAFLTSAEYQHRFGSTVTRTDQDCGP